jgi:hypothetical protein
MALSNSPPAPDWLFIGTTEWKLSAGAAGCILRAKSAGAHVGRNSCIDCCSNFCVDSVDGTYPAYNPKEAQRRFSHPLKTPLALPVVLSYRAVLGRDYWR